MNVDYLNYLLQTIKTQEHFNINIPLINNNNSYILNLYVKNNKLLFFIKENQLNVPFSKLNSLDYPFNQILELDVATLTVPKLNNMFDLLHNQNFCQHRYCFNKQLDNLNYCLYCFPFYNGIGQFNDDCCICLDKNNTSSVFLKCKHKIHHSCIDKFQNNKIKCPLCRQESILFLHKGFLYSLP